MRNADRNNNRNATVTRAWARVRVPVPRYYKELPYALAACTGRARGAT